MSPRYQQPVLHWLTPLEKQTPHTNVFSRHPNPFPYASVDNEPVMANLSIDLLTGIQDYGLTWRYRSI